MSLTHSGNIKNTEPLDSKRQRVHSFWVTAFDCGKNRAQADAQVIVTIKPSCKPGWIGNYFYCNNNKINVFLSYKNINYYDNENHLFYNIFIISLLLHLY